MARKPRDARSPEECFLRTKQKGVTALTADSESTELIVRVFPTDLGSLLVDVPSDDLAVSLRAVWGRLTDAERIPFIDMVSTCDSVIV